MFLQMLYWLPCSLVKCIIYICNEVINLEKKLLYIQLCFIASCVVEILQLAGQLCELHFMIEIQLLCNSNVVTTFVTSVIIVFDRRLTENLIIHPPCHSFFQILVTQYRSVNFLRKTIIFQYFLKDFFKFLSYCYMIKSFNIT